MRLKRYLRKALMLFALVSLTATTTMAYEFSGFKLEYMNGEETNFYGFGIFTSNKRFDAEVEFFAASKVFSGKADQTSPSTGDYKYFFFSFAGYFHFVRTDSISFYLGMGIFPFIPKTYIYHGTLGMDFFWTENFRVFYNYRYLYNNAQDKRYPSGATFSAGIKFTWDDF